MADSAGLPGACRECSPKTPHSFYLFKHQAAHYQKTGSQYFSSWDRRLTRSLSLLCYYLFLIYPSCTNTLEVAQICSCARLLPRWMESHTGPAGTYCFMHLFAPGLFALGRMVLMCLEPVDEAGALNMDVFWCFGNFLGMLFCRNFSGETYL